MMEGRVTAMQLSRLERVPVRDPWQDEADDFTPWLAEPENMELLGDAVGMNLEVEGVEKAVGPFSADILCRDTADGRFVLIENQLEATDHTHLGQILTYAAGLDAPTTIWVCTSFRDEHRAALDWLNQVTDEETHFFGVEVSLVRISGSPPAPVFDVVAKPNDWTKSVVETTSSRRRWDEPSFFADLEERSPAAVPVARALHEWALRRGFELNWGSGNRTGAFIPKIPAGDVPYYPFVVYSSGDVGIGFRYMVDKPVFGDESQRLVFMERLNQIPGVSLPRDRIGGEPPVAMTVFTDDSCFQALMETLEWFVEQVQAATPGDA